MVRAGQQVRAGDELIRLDPTQTGAEFGSGEATMSALDVKIARLEGGGRRAASRSIRRRAIRSLADQIRIEQALHASRMADLASSSAPAQRPCQPGRARGRRGRGQLTRRAAPPIEARRAEARILRPLVERGIEPRLSLVQAESAADVARERGGGRRRRPSPAPARPSPRRAPASPRRQQEWRAQAANELATAQAELSARRRALPALADRVERTVLRAPLPGRINRVLVTTRGGTVRAGEPVVEIVPSDESLLIEARVTPQDIAFVRLGQHARVAITAYDRSVYGVLEGSVVGISPDAVARGADRRDLLYRARPHRRERAARPARPADADRRRAWSPKSTCSATQRTILQYILSPITRLGETALRER